MGGIFSTGGIRCFPVETDGDGDRLKQNGYSEPFVSLGTTEEADFVTEGNENEKPNTWEAATKMDNLVETVIRKEEEGKKHKWQNSSEKVKCLGAAFKIFT